MRLQRRLSDCVGFSSISIFVSTPENHRQYPIKISRQKQDRAIPSVADWCKEIDTCLQEKKWLRSSPFVVYLSLQWPWPLRRHAGPSGRKEGYWSWQEPSSAAQGDLRWPTWCTDATVDWEAKAGPETRPTGEAAALVTSRQKSRVSRLDTWWQATYVPKCKHSADTLYVLHLYIMWCKRYNSVCNGDI